MRQQRQLLNRRFPNTNLSSMQIKHSDFFSNKLLHSGVTVSNPYHQKMIKTPNYNSRIPVINKRAPPVKTQNLPSVDMSNIDNNSINGLDQKVMSSSLQRAMSKIELSNSDKKIVRRDQQRQRLSVSLRNDNDHQESGQI